MVAAVAITRKDYTAEQLRAAAKRTKDAGTARRMLALALVLEGKSRIEAATSAAWTVKFYAIGYIAITLKVSRDFVTDRSRSEAEIVCRAGMRGGRAGSQGPGFGRAWCGSLAPD
jgi:hypothetical protein